MANFLAVANPIYLSNSHTKFGWISFNGKGEDRITDFDDARKYLEIFLFSKSLTCLLFASECAKISYLYIQRRTA